MEYVLRCNILTCRKELGQYAVVTTCSHIFCDDCADRHQLKSEPNRQAPSCPACDQHLVNPDDVVRTDLNPTEDYKTSVLSGLSPNTIMECAGRALNFWAYQTSQEILYQGMQAKVWTDRYNKLKGQMDTIIREANNEISELRANLNNKSLDYNNQLKKNQELVIAYKEKSRQQAQAQELYDKMRRREQMGHVQKAASEAVEHTIQASVTSNRYVDHFGNSHEQQHRSPIFPSLQGMAMAPPQAPTGISPSGIIDRNGSRMGWNNVGSQGSSQGAHGVSQTPSSHRQRLNGGANIGIGLSNLQNGRNLGTPLPPRISPAPGQVNNLRTTGLGGNSFAGYGMSAGLKVSHTPVSVQGLQSRSISQPRVAQRPASTSFINGRSTYGAAPTFNGGGEFY